MFIQFRQADQSPSVQTRRIHELMETLDKKKVVTAIKRHVLTEARADHDEIKVMVSNRGGFTIRAPRLPLDRYRSERRLGEGEVAQERYSAGNRLYRDFYLAGISGKLTVDLNAIPSGQWKGYLPSTEKQRIALDNYRAAIQAVKTNARKQLAINVCCYGYYLKDLTIPKKTAMQQLVETLDDLAAYYFN